MYLLSPRGPVRRVLAGAVLAWAGAAYAVDPVNPPPEVALSEVEALRQQIDALNKQLGNLEQRLTTQEQADAAACRNPGVARCAVIFDLVTTYF